ncbi:MAG: hypothetical protein ACKVS9_05075 [Phycisphaerae bacterium]
MTLTKFTQFAVAALIALVVGGSTTANAGGDTREALKAQLEALKKVRADLVIRLDESIEKQSVVRAELAQLQLSGARDRATVAQMARLTAMIRELQKTIVALRTEISGITARIEYLERMLA